MKLTTKQQSILLSIAFVAVAVLAVIPTDRYLPKEKERTVQVTLVEGSHFKPISERYTSSVTTGKNCTNYKSLLAEYESLLTNGIHTATVIEDIEDSVFNGRDFYNSDWHLGTDAAIKNTEHIAEQLKKFVK